MVAFGACVARLARRMLLERGVVIDLAAFAGILVLYVAYDRYVRRFEASPGDARRPAMVLRFRRRASLHIARPDCGDLQRSRRRRPRKGGKPTVTELARFLR
jgi:hypothetical protein